jgi:hypothetical protein
MAGYYITTIETATTRKAQKGRKMKEQYAIISGEGSEGTTEYFETTILGAKMRRTKATCGGDRWARLFRRLNDWDKIGIEVGTGEARHFDGWPA